MKVTWREILYDSHDGDTFTVPQSTAVVGRIMAGRTDECYIDFDVNRFRRGMCKTYCGPIFNICAGEREKLCQHTLFFVRLR